MEIFTSAPAALDYEGTTQFGQMGVLRIVSVEGNRSRAESQVLRYRDRGFYATVRRSDAAAYMTQMQTIEGPLDSAVLGGSQDGGPAASAFQGDTLRIS